MSYKRLIPCIFIYRGKAVKWFHDQEVIADSPVELAKYYSSHGADELIVFDLSNTDEEHEESIAIMKMINHSIKIPMIAGGNIKRAEDVKKILSSGAKRAMLNFSKPDMLSLIVEVSETFGKEKIAVSLNDFDALFKQQDLIEQYASELIFMHRLDLNSVMNITSIPCVVVTDTNEESELLKILKCPGVRGLSGKFVNGMQMDFAAFKDKCTAEDIKMTSFESMLEFSEFRLDAEGLISVIVQDYKTGDVLMMAHMDEEAFDRTVKTGKMSYHDRERNELWIKGEKSGHYQYVRSMAIDCDRDTILAKVEQVGSACHTGDRSCFHQSLVGTDYDKKNPLQIFESTYEEILEQKKEPEEGSYTTELFEKGMDHILKKIGEEATELIIAAKNPNPDEVKEQMSDFLYHAMVLMVEKGITWEDIIDELAERF